MTPGPYTAEDYRREADLIAKHDGVSPSLRYMYASALRIAASVMEVVDDRVQGRITTSDAFDVIRRALTETKP